MTCAAMYGTTSPFSKSPRNAKHSIGRGGASRGSLRSADVLQLFLQGMPRELFKRQIQEPSRPVSRFRNSFSAQVMIACATHPLPIVKMT